MDITIVYKQTYSKTKNIHTPTCVYIHIHIQKHTNKKATINLHWNRKKNLYSKIKRNTPQCIYKYTL